MPKTMAIKSMRNVMRMIGWVSRKRKPSTTAARPAWFGESSLRWSGASAGSLCTAYNVANSATKSKKYSQLNPTSGISAPPTTGPTIAPTCWTVMFRLVAAAMCFTPTSLGTIAVRVGWFTAKNACWKAKRTSRIHTLVAPTAANAQNPAAVTINPVVVM